MLFLYLRAIFVTFKIKSQSKLALIYISLRNAFDSTQGSGGHCSLVKIAVSRQPDEWGSRHDTFATLSGSRVLDEAKVGTIHEVLTFWPAILIVTSFCPVKVVTKPEGQWTQLIRWHWTKIIYDFCMTWLYETMKWLFYYFCAKSKRRECKIQVMLIYS